MAGLTDSNIQAALISCTISIATAIVSFIIQSEHFNKQTKSKLIDDIENLAIEHYASKGSDPNNHHRAMRLQTWLKHLGYKIRKNAETKQAIINFRKAITGGNFADPNRNFVVFDDPQITEITDQAKNLRQKMKLNNL